MSLARTLALMARDLRMGPRSPVLVWVILMPFLITFMVKVVFVTLLDFQPRLAIADLGSSELTATVREMEGIDLTVAGDAARVRELVESNDVDAGLVLAADFDGSLRAGERPEMELYVAGESLAMNRMILAVTAIDLIRGVEGKPASVEVRVRNVGGGRALPISELVLLCAVIMVLLVTALFAPGFLLVEEREKRTLEAILVTPATMSDVLMSKALLGVGMSLVLCLLTLVGNGVRPAEPVALLLALLIAAVTCVEIGLIYGTLARDVRTLYTLIKTLNIVVLAPLIFYFVPDWPPWIARLFPTYWCIEPMYQIALKGASLRDIWPTLTVAAAIAITLVPIVALLGRRMR